MDLGNALIRACQQPTSFHFLYPLDLSIKARALTELHTGCACNVLVLLLRARLKQHPSSPLAIAMQHPYGHEPTLVRELLPRRSPNSAQGLLVN